MKRELAKKWTEEIKHWGEGGNLWWYDSIYEKWIKYDNSINFTENDRSSYVIEDDFFELRKAFALGEIIQYKWKRIEDEWETTESPDWDKSFLYRVKPDELVYYLWEKLIDGEIYTSNYVSNDKEHYKYAGWRRIEDSKRTWEDEK